MKQMLLIYTKPDCGFCIKAKALAEERNIPFREVVIGVQISREDFRLRYPWVTKAPFIVHYTDADASNTDIQVTKKAIGGFEDLEKWVEE